MSSRLRTWLQLFRAPNLFTVPGDPLAGFLLVNGGDADRSLVLAIVAALCFYAAGLLGNDLADEEEDRRERPQRPLPSGAASASAVRKAALFLNIAGILALAFTFKVWAVVAGASLMASVALYNRCTKRWPVVGALNMGLCRALSVMLGAFAGPYAEGAWPMGLFAAVPFGLYIAAVTNLARHETRERAPIVARVLPSLAALGACLPGVGNALQAPAKEPAAGLFLLALLAVLWLGWQMFRHPHRPLPPLIGAHIRVLLILQAAACWFGDPWDWGRWSAFALLACWPLSRAVSRRFYAS